MLQNLLVCVLLDPISKQVIRLSELQAWIYPYFILVSKSGEGVMKCWSFFTYISWLKGRCVMFTCTRYFELIITAAFTNMILQIQFINWCGFVHVTVPVLQLWGENQVEMTEGGKQLDSVFSHFPAVTPVTCLPSDLSSVTAGHRASNVNRKGSDSVAMCWALRAFTLPWPWAPWPEQISIWDTWSTLEAVRWLLQISVSE